MKKILKIVIIVLILVLISEIRNRNEKEDLSNNTQNSLSNTSSNVNHENSDKEKNEINEENKIDNTIENNTENNEENENSIKPQEPENDTNSNQEAENVENKVPDNSYVGEEENSKDDYDTELDGENRAIVLVKEYLGDKASNYTFNVETTTSSAYVVRAMDENSSNTYFSVNFTTWIVSEI